ncbi:signal peptidase I [Agathobaculum sp. NTUH-O15-33]|uniref:signal peptidase I n=1 Tax=Agathobaculum sp. NTUH-O15-33 TaxID=3079302 RepID=UPI0029583F4E|nr:signal peptidase I [Agathobaculum sp. NTUH-O15-33]WNX83628.1 signal peptidase I [Agathobaculum sp. NTUH-O15-33]
MQEIQENGAGKHEKQEGRFKSELFGWGESLLTVLIFFVIVFTFFARLIGVDGSSMVPTLQDHNIMLVSNLNYTPEKGDIVVLNKPNFYHGQPIVKRVIATGGDTIEISADTGDVIVNGTVLDEPYIAEKINTFEHLGDMTYPQTVPEGCIFVMGDNRNHSSDSRRSDLGMVDERYVLGHVLSVLFPFSQFGSVE